MSVLGRMIGSVPGLGSLCRRLGRALSGVFYLALAGVVGICAVPDGDGADASDLAALPNHDYLGEVVRLREQSLEEAKQLARYISETEGMPNRELAKRIYAEIDREQRNWWNRTKRAASGFLTGEGGSIEELGGSVASDMFLYGDVRDLVKHAYFKLRGDEKGDGFIITLSAFGLATEFVDAVDWAPAVLKAFRKAGALSAKMVDLLSEGMKACLKTRKLDGGLKQLFSGFRSVTDALGFARAGRALRHADSAADVAALAKAAKLAPDETYLLVKHAGRDGIKMAGNLSEAQVRILREAAKKGPDALKNFRKYGVAVKERTAAARRIARLAKSVRAGHLTGLVHKLVLALPFLRYVFAGLSLVCVLLAGLSFRAAVRR